MEFVYSDGGRSKYFKVSNVGDCVTRAICNATGKDYLEVYKRLKELAKNESVKNHRGHKKSSVRDGVFKETWKEYLEEINWKRVKTMDMGTKERVHLRDGELPNNIIAIVQVSKHLTCLKNGVLYDTYDCSRDGERMVYGYYVPMTADEIAAKESRIQEQNQLEKAKRDAAAEKKKQQELLKAQIKKIKDKYKKKMDPFKKKLRALERAMDKEINLLKGED